MIEHPLELDYDCALLGLDEAGRGPMAGPLVVAGVLFPYGYENQALDDSKKLTEKKREALYSQIKADAIWYQIVFVDEPTIDRKNIFRATQDTMLEIAKEAPTDLILSDAMKLPLQSKTVIPIIKGDHKSISIAAASILAKVSRDHYMMKLDQMYPEYGFAKHKGYPTKAHKDALIQYGVLDCHRKSYGPVKEQLEYKLF